MTGGTNIAALRTALVAAESKASEAEAKASKAEAKATEAEARAAVAAAKVSDAEAEIAFLKLTIEKLRREFFGQRSERKQRLLDQLELQLDELEASATEDELAAEKAAAETTQVQGFSRRKPARKPFPAHIPRERKVVPPPTSCGCCGSDKLSKIGEDVTETLEVIPRQWKVIQTVREKFTCRRCEKISQPPAPFHPTPRGWAGQNLLAMILFEKYGAHQPLNRQRDRYAREGVDLSLSTLADQVGACAVALKPLHDLIEAHVMAAERLHGDDTPVPVLANSRSEPLRRALRQAVRCELYNPSRRSRRPTSPGCVQRSASSRIRSRYSAVNWRRFGLATTSGSGVGLARPALGASSLRSSSPRAGTETSFNVIESLSAVIGFHLRRPTEIPKVAGVSVMLAERGRSTSCRPCCASGCSRSRAGMRRPTTAMRSRGGDLTLCQAA